MATCRFQRSYVLVIIVFLVPFVVYKAEKVYFRGPMSFKFAIPLADGASADELCDDVKEVYRNDDRGRPPTKVLLMTYFRGGSSFLGETFNQNPQAFYWFEPSEPIFSGLREFDPYVMLKNGSIGKIPEESSEQICRLIIDILNCRFENLGLNYLTHFFITNWHSSKSLSAYWMCVKEKFPNSTDNNYPEDVVRGCIPLAVEKCRNATIRTLKAIRVAGFMLERLLALDPELKIIHYVRDPRASYVSAREIKFVGSGLEDARKWAKVNCHRLHQDYLALRQLKESLNILELRYEDLARSYNDTMSAIYSYVGHPIPEELLKWSRLSTKSSVDNGRFGTKRVNSTATSVRWRHVIPTDVKDVYDEICSEVFEDYRYDVQ